MSQTPLKQSNNPDPNVIQQSASDPLSSVWVGANAGTGKTKVLVDRLLRLLLPRQLLTGEVKQGTDPSKILCLTFTKAAASEMANRVNETLARWTTLSDDALIDALENLTGQRPNDVMRDAARRLFAQVIDTPGGMKIMTLHSFCQSVLSRFPLEAGVIPGFQIADDRQVDELMNNAIQNLIRTPPPSLENALSYFMGELDAKRFKNVLKELMKKRQHIKALLKEHIHVDGVITHLYQHYGFSPEKINDLNYSVSDQIALRKVVSVLMTGTPKTDQQNAAIICEFLDDKNSSFKKYQSVFLTQAGVIKADTKLMTKKLGRQYPEILSILQHEARQVFNHTQQLRLIKTLEITALMWRISAAVIDEYSSLKKQHALLDYDDQINLTATLLSRHNTPQWVLYKLDNGLDHILVDEAQDTSPPQWQIIQKISEEFFQGIGTHSDDVIRTIFAVGDEKQSIYSFQDADPELFLDMADYFSRLTQQAKKNWRRVDMAINFRSSPVILNAVDHLLRNDTLRQKISLQTHPISHIPYHGDRPGLVELWPPYELAEQQIGDVFYLPTARIPQSNPMIMLCRDIANTIATWINEKRFLPSYNRPVQVGDIMILLQSRRPMMDALIKALKDKNIPVTGTDRMILSEQLVVKDILSFIQFCLLPSDDLILATVLKSPLIGMSEENLFTIAHARGDLSLWQSLKNHYQEWPQVIEYLNHFLCLSQNKKPFDFISDILLQPCPASPESGKKAFFHRLGMEVKDPLDELLNAAQSFEQSHPPGLQGFTHWLKTTETEIKRELSNVTGQVRIMTVHGSKGLQAPIVFIPDAFKKPSASNKNYSFYWPKDNQTPFLWASGEIANNAAIDDLKKIHKETEQQEYYRLLYVALTRAEDELYIAGWTRKTSNEDSWYTEIKNAWQNYGEIIPYKDKTALRLTHKGKTKKQDQKEEPSLPSINLADFSWLRKKAPTEPQRPTPLSPSRPTVKSSAVQSPMERTALGPFWRGSLIHKILQTLPTNPPEQWSDILSHYLQQPHLKLDSRIQKQLHSEIMAVLRHPDYQSLFSQSAQAEVPIVGEVIIGKKSHAISGQIDRLLITENTVWIVDYKTNRPCPSSLDEVPKDYIFQMATYYALLKQLYPKHKISCVLLWTHAPSWMALPQGDLENALQKIGSA